MRASPVAAVVALALGAGVAMAQTDEATTATTTRPVDPQFAGRVFASPIPAVRGDSQPGTDDVAAGAGEDTTVTADPAATDPGTADPAATDGTDNISTRSDQVSTDPAGTDTASLDPSISDSATGETTSDEALPNVRRPGDVLPGDEASRDGRFKRVPEGASTPDERPPVAPLRTPETVLKEAARLRQLDKMTGKTTTFDMTVGETRQVQRLKIRLDACRAPNDNDQHGTMAFLKIWDTKHPGDPAAFSGWMFAESPALSALDHPRYDLWVINCTTVSGETSAASE